MSESIDRHGFLAVLSAVLRAHGLDPIGTSPVPFSEMASISRAVSEGLRVQNSDQQYELLDLLIPEILDQSMTEQGRRLAVTELGKDLGFQISRPS